MIKLIERSEVPALVGKNTSYTRSQLLAKIEQYTALLPEMQGERLVIFSENREEWIFTLYAGWKKGMIIVPVDALLPQEDVDYIIKDSAPAVIFCSEDRAPMVNTACRNLDSKAKVFVFNQIQFDTTPEEGSEIVADDLQRTALILYTSGTTGNPKGVMLSFENLYTNLKGVCHDVEIYKPGERTLILLPFHHILPLMGSIIAPLYSGGTMVMNTSLAADEMMAVLKEYAVTIMIGVPRLYQLIYKGIREKIRQSAIARIMLAFTKMVNSKSLSMTLFGSVHRKFGGHLKYLVCGGAPVEPEVGALFKDLGFEFLEGFGMTETAPMITFTRPGRIRPGIPGELLPGVNIRFDEGEIMVSGGNVMQGYFNKPEETAAVLHDGWLRTGDLGFMDEDGYLHITGRKKELIVLPNGKNINPEEVEIAIYRQSAFVKETGVFLKDGILQALIVPDFRKMSDEGIPDISEYMRWNVIDPMNKTIAPYKKILRFHVVSSELPKTRLGKLKRFMLPEMATERRQSVQEEPRTKEYQTIKKFLEEETQQTVHPDDHLELDLALDSLGRVSLSAFIETAFGVDVPENTLSDFQSVSKLAEHLHLKKTRLNFDGISWSQILKEKVHLKLPESWFTHNLIRNMLQVGFTLTMRVKSKGIENLPDEACIIAPNHQSVIDGFLVASLFKRRFMKKTYVYAKEKHFHGTFLRFLANRNNIILVDVNKDLKLSIQKLAVVLKKGKNLMIFPEGTRSQNGKMGEFKQTFAILSQELKVPVVPVAIKGSYNILPAGSRFPRLFRRVSVEFLQPVYPDNHTYESLKNLVRQRLSKKLED